MKYCPACQRAYEKTERSCPIDGARLSLKDPYRLVGRTLDHKYRIDALIGVGGMGAVYCALHIGIERPVAFKILLPHLILNNEKIVELFEGEAKKAGRLRHVNIVDVFDAGHTSDGIAYIAMELLEGCTLDEGIESSALFTFERTFGILQQIALALDAAHSKHIIHRDLKPSNVMLIDCPGKNQQVKVLDFGISKALTETIAGKNSAPIGTPHYASPEQFRLGDIDHRSDIYSLGIVLYQMLTRELPFDAPSLGQLIQAQLTASPPSLRALRPDIPIALEQLVHSMLEKDPNLRPQSVVVIPGLFNKTLQPSDASPPSIADTATLKAIQDDEGSRGDEAIDGQVGQLPPSNADVRTVIEQATNEIVLQGSSDQNSLVVWRKLYRNLRGKEIAELCHILEDPKESVVALKAILLLGYSAAQPEARPFQSLILLAVSNHILQPSTQEAGLKLIQRLRLPHTEIWQCLFDSLQLVQTTQAASYLAKAIRRVTTLEERDRTGELILELFSVLEANGYINELTVTIEALDYQKSIPALREIFYSGEDSKISLSAGLLAKWQDKGAVAHMRQYIEAKYRGPLSHAYLEVLKSLYKIEGSRSAGYIAEILLNSSVQNQTTFNDYSLKDFKNEPEITGALRKLFEATGDAQVKKGVGTLIDRS